MLHRNILNGSVRASSKDDLFDMHSSKQDYISPQQKNVLPLPLPTVSCASTVIFSVGIVYNNDLYSAVEHTRNPLVFSFSV